MNENYNNLITAYNSLIEVEGIELEREIIRIRDLIQEVEIQHLKEPLQTHEFYMPIVKCKDNGSEYHFYCKYCKRVHVHSRGNGSRVAHCRNGPYKKTGYILECE